MTQAAPRRSRGKLAVFDIDGTLTLGDGLGTRCFFKAFDEVFGGGMADRRLATYAESTDGGIAREAAERALGRAATARELEAFKAAYLSRLEREILAHGSAYRPVPGAERFLPILASHQDWQVAIATGNWRRAAALKLDTARIPPPIVAACSEDGPTRAAVLAAAVASAATVAGIGTFESVVYVGDQTWDLAAALEIGAGFVGVGSHERGRHLAAAGARVVEGYLDPDTLLALLEEAATRCSAADEPITRAGPGSP